MDEKRIKAILEEMRKLLQRSEYDAQAKYLSRLIAWTDCDRQAFHIGLTSMELWGGDGSVNDFCPITGSIEEARSFSRCLVDLADTLADAGIRNGRMEFIARTNRMWLEQDIWTNVAESAQRPVQPVRKRSSKESLKRKGKRYTD